MKTIYALSDALNFSQRKSAAADDPGVYGLAAADEPGNIRYVGSTTSFAHRLYSHWHSSAPARRPTPKHLWLCGLRETGREPVMVVLERCDVGPRQSPVRHAKEQAHIAKLAPLGMCDLNVHLTPIGHTHSQDSWGKVLRAEIARLKEENARLRALLSADIA